MNKYTEIAQQTRQNLLDAFWELYCEKRIEKITVRELTAKAGYSRGTFYEYFTDVYDVLEQLEQSLLPKVEDIPQLMPEDGRDESPADAFMKLYSESSAYYSVLLGDKGDPAFATKMKNGIKERLLTQLGEETKATREFDYELEYMLSAMIGILTYWFGQGEDISKEELVQMIHELMDSERLRNLALKLGM